MKTTKKSIKAIVTFVAIASVLSINSCQKENLESPSNAATGDQNTSLLSNSAKPNANALVYPANCSVYGSSYAAWSAKWWKWAMEYPVAGHPFIDDPSFNVSNRQSGNVWFLAAPFGTVTRFINIPRNKALFVGLLNAEASDLEGLGNNYVERRDNAKFNADHIRNLSVSIDCAPLTNVNCYRFLSPQFSFKAPNPWIFSPAPNGCGVSVADGYYILIKPLSCGQHKLHYSGDFHFAIAEGDPFDFDAALDMTYHINVQ